MFVLLVGSILFVSAGSLNNNKNLVINDIVASNEFTQLKGFKQLGFKAEYGDSPPLSFDKESNSYEDKKGNKFKSKFIEVESIYEEIDTSFFNVDERSIKQKYIIKNLKKSNKNVKINLIYEIDSDFVVWNGTTYGISNEPIYFEAFEEIIDIIPGLTETFFNGHTLSFGNNYFDFKDIIDLDYTVSVYSLNEKNYIDLEINGEIDGLGEFIIDPIIGFTTHVITTSADGALSVFAIDIDGDNDIDVLSASFWDDKIAWYENDGSSPPNWTTHIITTSVDGAISVYAIDLDNDNDNDVLSASFNGNKVEWYENDGSSPPSWTTHVITTAVNGAHSVFAIDIDNDNDIDVLSASSHDDKIAWYENNGSSSPGWTTHIITGNADFAIQVYAVDIDNDNDIDVLSASHDDDKISWYENDGSFPPNWITHDISTSADRAYSVFAIDIDNDNDIDVLSGSTGVQRVAWYENDGNSPPNWITHNITTDTSGRSVYAIDLDNDNDIDALSASISNDKIAWYENDGNSPPNWTSHSITTSALSARSVYAIDLDNDNDIDVISASLNDDKVAWYESNLPPPPPDTIDLEILEIIPMQVVRDVDMVKDKSGIVRVIVRNNGLLNANATVNATLDGGLLDTIPGGTDTKLVLANQNQSFDFGFNPTGIGTQTFIAEVEIG